MLGQGFMLRRFVVPLWMLCLGLEIDAGVRVLRMLLCFMRGRLRSWMGI